jgi:hypothetical protein
MLQEWDCGDKTERGQSAGKRPCGGGSVPRLHRARFPTLLHLAAFRDPVHHFLLPQPQASP